MGRFWNQTKALFIKNITYQKRHPRANAWIILFPAILFGLLLGYQFYQKKNPGDVSPAVMPTEWPPLLAIPTNEHRAVKTSNMPYSDLPDTSCRQKNGLCPVTSLITGSNKTLTESWANNLYQSSAQNSSNVINLADDVWGREVMYAFAATDTPINPDDYLYHVDSHGPVCPFNSTYPVVARIGNNDTKVKARCLQSLNLLRENYTDINKELFQGYYNGNPKGEINEIVAAYDLLDSSATKFNAHVWYNSSYGSKSAHVPRVLSMFWNAYLQFVRGPSLQMILEYVGEMGVPEHRFNNDLSRLAALFFPWVFLQLFPVTLSSLVYEKQQKMQIMMKMHGLGDGPYWVIMYLHFFIIGSIYTLLVIGLGSLSGLAYFRLNSIIVQILFYGIHMNLLILSAFLLSSLFSRTKTASVISYILILGTWMFSVTVVDNLINDATFPRAYLIILELFPGFSLYRGLYELQEYGYNANQMGTYGVRWSTLSDRRSGIREAIIIMSAEWLLLLILAHVNKVFALVKGFQKFPISFSNKSQSLPMTLQNPGFQDQNSRVLIQMDKQDVDQEKEKVKELLGQPHPSYPIISDNLMKTYPRKNGSPEKHAVRGLSLAVARGECFGLLGPNGAGKTSFLNMMTGITKPSSGTAYIGGFHLQKQISKIYESIGVCPQDNFLWESLTGREHLMFYGRLKNLRGHALTQAVEDSLRSVKLLQDADKRAGQYSGGMKRRLSVAISLIGDPKVVYMDEPATGLDPASRDTLWDVVQNAKQDRAIILTTHSMAEAERLCDRVGIFVDGNLQCIGSPDQNIQILDLAMSEVWTFSMLCTDFWEYGKMTSEGKIWGKVYIHNDYPPENEMDVERMACGLCPDAKKVYNLNGTQKFEMPKEKVKLSNVFKAVTNAKTWFDVRAWEVSETTLEDVFVKVATEAQPSLA